MGLLLACTNTRPIAKIGLLAPFEGLYRRTGYDALTTVRSAIDQVGPGDVALIPLAEDISLDPDRTAAKMLADPLVRAVIGPLDPATSAAVEGRLAGADVLWVRPFAVDPQGGFATEIASTTWATELVAEVAQAAAQNGATSLLLAGWTPGWPSLSAERWTSYAGIPIRLDDEPAHVAPGEAVLWLGSPADGARYFVDLRKFAPDAPFWMGPQGGDPVFLERVLAEPVFAGQGLGPVFWATWLTDEYDEWRVQHEPGTPADFLVHKATLFAMARATGAIPTEGDLPWRVRIFPVTGG